MFDSKPLIQKLLRHQESLSMTLKDFARFLGVDPAKVYRWRKGQGNYNPTLDRLSIIADKLGITVIELLTPDAESAQGTPAPAPKTAKASAKTEKTSKAARSSKGKKADAKEDKTKKAATKTSAAKSTRSTKAKKVDAPADEAKKGRKTAVKTAKASVTPASTADTEKTALKKRGRPKKVSQK